MKIKELHGKYTEYFLNKTDEKYGIVNEPTVVTIRLAGVAENQARNLLLQSCFFDVEPRRRGEMYLTLTGSNILNDEGDNLFTFNEDYYLTEESFSKAWNNRDFFIFDEIQECIYASNPSWAKEDELIDEIGLKFYECLLKLSLIPSTVKHFDPKLKVRFRLEVNINDQKSIIPIPPE